MRENTKLRLIVRGRVRERDGYQRIGVDGCLTQERVKSELEGKSN